MNLVKDNWRSITIVLLLVFVVASVLIMCTNDDSAKADGNGSETSTVESTVTQSVPTATSTSEPMATVTTQSDPTPNTASSQATGGDLEFGGADRNDRCPTDGSMQSLLGLGDVKPVFTGQNIPWDPCKWNFQSTAVVTFNLPALWQATITLPTRQVIVFYGTDGLELEAYGATIRYTDAYATDEAQWVNDPLGLISQEYRFGISRIPAYTTQIGNFDVSGWIEPDVGQTCPESPAQAAALIGGDYRYWDKPTQEDGAWVFRDPTHNFHTLRHPGGSGHLDVWTETTGALEIRIDNTLVLRRLNFEEASFHCN